MVQQVCRVKRCSESNCWAALVIGGLVLIWSAMVTVPALGDGNVAQQREEKVRRDREKVQAAGLWLYNDLAQGVKEAKRTQKPILVVLRCIPCEECVKLDDELVDQDPVIRPLLEQFVCVRQVSTNGLDLRTFQYDTDQSFAVFMMNADGTIYGRFGTRSHRTEWIGDVSLPGLAKALQGALELHAKYPANRAQLEDKRGKPLEVNSPEQYPALRGKYQTTLNFQKEVVKNCIHCHQIGEAQRSWYREQKKEIPEEVLFPYPHPQVIGLKLDPKEKATILEIEAASPAEQAGLQAADEILQMNGQPLLSIADVQWVLHQIPARGGKVAVEVRRAGQPVQLQLKLPKGWRQAGDLSWRVTTWSLRRMTTGGMVLEELTSSERQDLGLAKQAMALRVKGVGQYAPHDVAKKAGITKGDLIVGFGGRNDFLTETALLFFGLNRYQPGDRIPVIVQRDGRTREILITAQK